MNRCDIKECKDIEVLRGLCLLQQSQLFRIGELLVDESKKHIPQSLAITRIREILNSK